MEENKPLDPRYAPPYPQNFYKFWPGHAIRAGIVVVLVIGLILFLALWYQIPTDYSNVLPDDGMYIPGPEWYLLFLFQTFWYMKGGLAKWQFIGTLIIPLSAITFIVIIPFIFKRKRSAEGISSRLLYLLPPASLFLIIILSIIYSGYPAKLHGCISCHNIQAGVRHNLPPMDVLDYYKTARQKQIEVGRYRASKTGTKGESVIGQEVETYKDANWHMRHIYEPAFTW